MSDQKVRNVMKPDTSIHTYLCGIEEVDTLVPGCLHTVLYDGTLLSTSVCEPSTEGKNRDLETGAAEVAEDLKSGC